ncbi:MAG: FAD-binding domain-containing protein [Phototrophicaceae bacterium]
MVHIVWYKRDLRLADHQPLSNAASHGEVLPLYVIEPDVIHAPDYSRRQYEFTRDCLIELRQNLKALGQGLVVRHGHMLDILDELHEAWDIEAIHAHEETGNAITYARDLAVHRWCKQHNIVFHETPNNGIIRPLKDRDLRRKFWYQQMDRKLATPPQLLPTLDIDLGDIPSWKTLNIRDEKIEMRQMGGELEAWRTLNQFLYERGANYHKEMSSPLTAEDSCSRISPHLAYGTLSLKQVMIALQKRRNQIADMPEKEYKALEGSWKSALRAFNSRLHWHDHFIQKLEDEPQIESNSFVKQYDALRDDPTTDQNAQKRFEAYQWGVTGFPMIDASMRYLRATGWINFRMRAMLVSFASYDLWIKWQYTAEFLARLFTDYEAGIHFPQVQMQSGTTGINTLRVYSPIKQAYDQDPNGTFIRQWIPELRNVPDAHIHEPHKMPPMTQLEVSCVIGKDYPAPIVDHKIAAKAAKDKIWELRKRPDVKLAADAVLEKHGSRKKRT